MRVDTLLVALHVCHLPIHDGYLFLLVQLLYVPGRCYHFSQEVKSGGASLEGEALGIIGTALSCDVSIIIPVVTGSS